MSLKKRLITIVAVIGMVAATLYGSTQKISGVSEDEGRLSWFGEKETVYFWYSDETLTDYLNAAAVSFGEQEGVRVIPVMVSDSEYLEAVNQASLDGQHAPDAYLLSNDLLEKAYLAGLAGKIQDEGNICNESHFSKAALDAVTYKGRQIAYPFFFETSVLLYNRTYMEEWAKQQAMKELENLGEEATEEQVSQDAAGENSTVDETLLAQKTQEYLATGVPTTVDDILQVADTFDVPEGVESVFKWDVSDIFYNYWIVGQYMIAGGDAGDDATNMNINNPETVQCLEVYKALNQFFFIESDTVTYDSVIQDFMDGKTVFTIATPDVVNRLARAKEDGSFVYEYGIAPMPDVSPELKSRSMSVTNTVVVNGYSAHKELANRFASYLTTEYVDNLYQQTEKVAADLHANAGNEELQVFMTEYAGSVPLPKMMATGNFWLHLEVLFHKIWNGAEVVSTVQELADQMALQIQE